MCGLRCVVYLKCDVCHEVFVHSNESRNTGSEWVKRSPALGPLALKNVFWFVCGTQWVPAVP